LMFLRMNLVRWKMWSDARSWMHRWGKLPERSVKPVLVISASFGNELSVILNSTANRNLLVTVLNGDSVWILSEKWRRSSWIKVSTRKSIHRKANAPMWEINYFLLGLLDINKVNRLSTLITKEDCKFLRQNSIILFRGYRIGASDDWRNWEDISSSRFACSKEAHERIQHEHSRKHQTHRRFRSRFSENWRP